MTGPSSSSSILHARLHTCDSALCFVHTPLTVLFVRLHYTDLHEGTTPGWYCRLSVDQRTRLCWLRQVLSLLMLFLPQPSCHRQVCVVCESARNGSPKSTGLSMRVEVCNSLPSFVPGCCNDDHLLRTPSENFDEHYRYRLN